MRLRQLLEGVHQPYTFQCSVRTEERATDGQATLDFVFDRAPLDFKFPPWSPAGMGCLTGKINVRTKLDPETDLRSGFDRFSAANIAANKPIVDLLTRVAHKESATPAQVALAWLLAQKPWIVPIPGTHSLGHFQENVQAIAVRLSPSALGGMATQLAKLKVHGGRMNAMQMKAVDQTA